MKWHPFNPSRGYHQKRPPLRKHVLVQLEPQKPDMIRVTEEKWLQVTHYPCIAVGYRKDAAGDKNCPYFVVPGYPGSVTVTHWCDCLPDTFIRP